MNFDDPLAFHLVQSMSKFQMSKVGSGNLVSGVPTVLYAKYLQASCLLNMNMLTFALIDDNSVQFLIAIFSFSSFLKVNDTMCVKLDVIQTATFESHQLNSPEALLLFLILIRFFFFITLLTLIPSAVILPPDFPLCNALWENRVFSKHAVWVEYSSFCHFQCEVSHSDVSMLAG